MWTLEDESGIDGVREGPLRRLRPRAYPRIGIHVAGIILHEHWQVLETGRMANHLVLRRRKGGTPQLLVKFTDASNP